MGKRKYRLRRREKRGTHGPVAEVPGTLTIEPDALPSTARILAFSPDTLVDKPLEDYAELRRCMREQVVTWLDVTGVGDADLIKRIGEVFGLHPLALEDVVHTHQRAKVETYPAGYFVVVRMPEFNSEGLYLEQLSLFFGEKYVVTFQEREGDSFAPVRERIRLGRGRVRKQDSDYLAYVLLDAIADSYFPILEAYSDRLEELEDKILGEPNQALVSEVHAIKRELLVIRRAVWPMRETVGQLLRDESPLISTDTRLYLRDVYDHTIQLVELTESYREVSSGLLDVYLSSMSNRMNEVMKVLTIISTIFIPLSFVAGVWGMNFDPDSSPLNMPELRWMFGYPMALAIMSVIAGGLVWFFRRKKWL